MACFAAFSFSMVISILTGPLAIVIVVSVVVGLAMVVLFGYTSDQKAIGIAKDQLKAHLLAVRLYRDQIPVVMGSYGKILRGTVRYLKLAFKPLLYVIVPITLLMVQMDRYLGQTPIPVNAPFLLTVHFSSSDALNDATLALPSEIVMTAPPVHIAADYQIVWRLAGTRDGSYEMNINAGGQSVEKVVCVGAACRGFRRCVCAGSSGIVFSLRRNLRYRKMFRSSPFRLIIQIATSRLRAME